MCTGFGPCWWMLQNCISVDITHRDLLILCFQSWEYRGGDRKLQVNIWLWGWCSGCDLSGATCGLINQAIMEANTHTAVEMMKAHAISDPFHVNYFTLLHWRMINQKQRFDKNWVESADCLQWTYCKWIVRVCWCRIWIPWMSRSGVVTGLYYRKLPIWKYEV